MTPLWFEALHIIFGELSFELFYFSVWNTHKGYIHPCREVRNLNKNAWNFRNKHHRKTEQLKDDFYWCSLQWLLFDFLLLPSPHHASLLFQFHRWLCCIKYILIFGQIMWSCMLMMMVTMGVSLKFQCSGFSSLKLWIILKRLNPSAGVCYSWKRIFSFVFYYYYHYHYFRCGLYWRGLIRQLVFAILELRIMIIWSCMLMMMITVNCVDFGCLFKIPMSGVDYIESVSLCLPFLKAGPILCVFQSTQ